MGATAFSIITVTYNAINTLEKTILSVLSQDSTLFEYIIIDGGSTDGTLECIAKYQHGLKYWVSEPDNGIYDAMNKGLDVAMGDWILFLGADDRLRPGVLKLVNNSIDSAFDLIYGNVMFENGSMFISNFNFKTILNNTVHHQGAFYNKRLFERFRYDQSIAIMSDYELNLLIYLHNKPRKKLNLFISECDVNGISSSIVRTLKETNFVRSKHFSPRIGNILSFVLKLKYFFHYKILDKL